MIRHTEKFSTGQQIDRQSVFDQLPFDAQGLLPAIAQQYDSLEVLMMAFMNRESLEETLKTGRVCYFSRSRQKLWRKGESSGQVQYLKEMRLDCDGDTLLLLVDQRGPACHTGRRSCFYNRVDQDTITVDKDVLIDPDTLYQHTD